jgi:hypothetical protein
VGHHSDNIGEMPASQIYLITEKILIYTKLNHGKSTLHLPVSNSSPFRANYRQMKPSDNDSMYRAAPILSPLSLWIKISLIVGELPTRFFVNLNHLILFNCLKLTTCPAQNRIIKYYLHFKK